MNKFRDNTPVRRPGRKTITRWQWYRPNLREDFDCRCWYCNDSDLIRVRNYAIDHFVPRNPDKKLPFSNPVPDNNYYNLVYSCSFCNLAKSNKWPTRDGSIHNNGTEWFIDPTDDEYTNLFKRNKGWKIECNDINPDLAKYIIRELKLWYPIHSLNWRFEKIIKLEEKVRKLLEKQKNEELQRIHYDILQAFRTLTTWIFKENE